MMDELIPVLVDRARVLLCALALVIIGSNLASAQSADQHANADVKAFKSVPFEELFNIEITTVSRRPERLVNAASAIQVITGEEIRRSGAKSLPEALRLATNLQVAQQTSANWIISARGFASATSDKLLVLIDGRTVYTPLFSGVFWDVQNVMLEDIDRIEVISGPGATLWGSNAVNGVINVITKNSRDTQGALATTGGGSYQRAFGDGRYGGKMGDDLYYRVYGLGFGVGNTFLSNGSEARDDWRLGQGGFRADWLPSGGTTLRVQGDYYGGNEALSTPGNLTVDGQNLLGRWTRTLGTDNEISAQVYWDRTHRRNPGTFSEALNTYDFEVQHRFRWGERNRILYGATYRLLDDHVHNGPKPNFAFLPTDKTMHLGSGFLQDEITLVPDLFLTLGSKFEYNTFSHFEVQPTIRLAWNFAPDQTLWGAISRAVRTPSRIDTEVFVPAVPPYFLRGGGSQYDSEKVVAYELGYRAELMKKVTVSLSTFFNDYDDVRSVEPIAGAPGQFIILNKLRAKTYGAEWSLAWQASEWWRLRGGYTYFHKRILFDNSRDINHGTAEGNDPHHQFLIQSMINLPANFEFDSVLRYVDNLNQIGPTIPNYTALDLRLGWRPSPTWEFAVVGQNLTQKRHVEYGAPGTPSIGQEIPRSVYGKLTWRFSSSR
ncbi:MAG TPA: TonB-dependent receptor [Candidatus Binatia bacterium]